MNKHRVFLILTYLVSAAGLSEINGQGADITLLSSAVLSPAVVPEISVDHGFYNEAFDVLITSPMSNVIIRYTLDGSDPGNSKTALQKSSPALVRIDPESSEGQHPKAPGVVLRACIIAPDSSLSSVVTRTYLFINKTVALSPEGKKPGTAWPNQTTSSNPQAIDYGMAADIINDTRYKDLIDDALLAIPSISVATDLNNLFASDSGIYMKAYQDGEAWERPASIELLNPDCTKGFQIDAGIRIRGGASRSGSNPKHAFRLFFKKEYGEGKLNFPLFGTEGTDKFDNVDLRTAENYAWSFPGHLGEYNTMISEVFSRDLQRETGQPYTRSRFYHLYINGVYFGLYQTQERPEASFAESYFGGTAEDYDVIKPDDNSTIMATDGNTTAYKELWNLCVSGFGSNSNYFKLQGLNTDGTRNESYKILVDIDNLIDYMLIVFYTGNFDGPTCKFYQNKIPRNFFGIYNRRRNDGFRFIIHDAEHTLRTTAGEGPGVGLYENRVNIGGLTSGDSYKMTVQGFSGFHPQWLHYKLCDNAEYRIRFADRVYKHFFNQGCMTPDRAKELFLARVKEIEMAIIAESARWGNTYHTPARNKDDDWEKAVDDIVNNYFPYRTKIVLSQLKNEGLYPKVDFPVFTNCDIEITSQEVNVSRGYVLKIRKQEGVLGNLVYTTDGKDPRAIEGRFSASAKEAGDIVELIVNSNLTVKARVLNGTNWSALKTVTLLVNSNISDLKLTEINYHPLSKDNTSDNDYEFLEMKNTGVTPVNLSRSNFTEGITYSFPNGTIIEPGKFLILASDREKFNERYGFLPFDTYSGLLDNNGERVTLCSSSADTAFSVKYSDKFPWPEKADGLGYSLVTKDIYPTGDLNDAAKWRASFSVNGSPGKDDLTLTQVENKSSKQLERFTLYQNYPNPFNPDTQIKYYLKKSEKVNLSVYDILGREISVLVNDFQEAGNHELKLSGDNLPSGVYLYRLQTDKGSKTKKMMLLR